MLKDTVYIERKYPTDMQVLRVYAIGDVHVGSQDFDLESTQKMIRIIENDPCAAVVICGDLGDFGLKNSRTNIYQSAIPNPKEQIEVIHDLFSPIASKISAAVPGNHEERLVREVGVCPLYDLCVRWGIQEVYRENVAITKYVFGSYKGDRNQNVFFGITSHGSSRNKHHKHILCYEGADFSVSGHNHTPYYAPEGRLRIERGGKANEARHVPFKEIVVNAHLRPGGYSLKHEYEIAPPPELPYLELTMVRENNRNRTLHRIMNYHTITI